MDIVGKNPVSPDFKTQETQFFSSMRSERTLLWNLQKVLKKNFDMNDNQFKVFTGGLAELYNQWQGFGTNKIGLNNGGVGEIFSRWQSFGLIKDFPDIVESPVSISRLISVNDLGVYEFDVYVPIDRDERYGHFSFSVDPKVVKNRLKQIKEKFKTGYIEGL